MPPINPNYNLSNPASSGVGGGLTAAQVNEQIAADRLANPAAAPAVDWPAWVSGQEYSAPDGVYTGAATADPDVTIPAAFANKFWRCVVPSFMGANFAPVNSADVIEWVELSVGQTAEQVNGLANARIAAERLINPFPIPQTDEQVNGLANARIAANPLIANCESLYGLHNQVGEGGFLTTPNFSLAVNPNANVVVLRTTYILPVGGRIYKIPLGGDDGFAATVYNADSDMHAGYAAGYFTLDGVHEMTVIFNSITRGHNSIELVLLKVQSGADDKEVATHTTGRAGVLEGLDDQNTATLHIRRRLFVAADVYYIRVTAAKSYAITQANATFLIRRFP